MGKLDAKTAAKSWEWEVGSDGGVAITKRVKSRARKVEVPSEIDGKPVVGIGESAFFESKSPRQISLPATLRSIGEEAFGGCASLAEIELPPGLETLGRYAFCNCESLRKVALPPGLETLGDCAFLGTALTDVALPAGLETLFGVDASRVFGRFVNGRRPGVREVFFAG